MVNYNLIATIGAVEDDASRMIRDALGAEVATGKMDSLLKDDIQSFTRGAILKGKIVGKAGDDFVVETRTFTDNTWIWAEGRASPHSDQLRIVERYRRVDRNTLEIEATLHDPKVLTAPWTVPKQTLVLAPFDQILPLNCAEL